MYYPFVISRTTSISALALNQVAANAGASANIRLGIYTDNGSGRPGVVIAQGSATQSASAMRSVSISPAVVLTPGVYWIAFAAQNMDTAGTNPTFSSCAATTAAAPETSPQASNNYANQWISTGISGAFADLPTVTVVRSTTASVWNVWAQVDAVTVAAPADEDAAVQLRIPTGSRFSAQHLGLGTTQPNGAELRVTPIVIRETMTIDRIGVEVTTVGSAGSVTRLGVWRDNNGVPGLLLLDAGTVDSTTTGLREITISQLLTPGIYWLGACSQGSPTTQPTYRTASQIIPFSAQPSAPSYMRWCRSYYGVSGAFGNLSGGSLDADQWPRVELRRT
jgi:hypothetical protein